MAELREQLPALQEGAELALLFGAEKLEGTDKRDNFVSETRVAPALLRPVVVPHVGPGAGRAGGASGTDAGVRIPLQTTRKQEETENEDTRNGSGRIHRSSSDARTARKGSGGRRNRFAQRLL